MRYPLIALDLDGTLTNSQKKISPRTRAALHAAIAAGARVVLASGRPLLGIQPLADELELPRLGGYILAYNGALILDCQTGKPVYERALSADVVLDACAAARELGVAALAYDERGVISERPDDPYVRREAFNNAIPVEGVADLAARVTWPPPKLMVVGEPKLLAPACAEIQARLSGRANVFLSEAYFLEITPLGVEKATALGQLLGHLGLESEQLLAIGDGLNDITMLRCAGLSVAMQNAYDETKAAARVVTASNDEDGVAKAVELCVLAEDALGLDDDPWAAILDAQGEASRSEEALALIARDAAALKDPQGPREILADRARLRAVYGEKGDMHALLVLLTRFGALRERYERHAIDSAVLRDTLRDVAIWMDACHRVSGRWGLREYGFLTHHFRFQLFRLGRLEYVLQPCALPCYALRGPRGRWKTLALDGARFTPSGEADGADGHFDPAAWTARFSRDESGFRGCEIDARGRAHAGEVVLPADQWQLMLSPGDPVLDVHIPEGERLDREAVISSMRSAPAFFARHLGAREIRALTCESWMLDWALEEIAPGSNLAWFSALFRRAPSAGGERQMVDRVFGFDVPDPARGPDKTSLQRAIQAWYACGGRCRGAFGYIPL